MSLIHLSRSHRQIFRLKIVGYFNSRMEGPTVHNDSKIRPQFGNRYLKKEDDVFVHNAWDNIDWNEQQEREAREIVEKHNTCSIPEQDGLTYETEADRYWDSFYNIHQNRFFKDRHWLFTEFPELAPNTTGSPNSLKCDEKKIENTSLKNDLESWKIFELGCGVGNTILPILKYCKNENLMVYGCDLSPKAIQILTETEGFDSKLCKVFVMDIKEIKWNVPFPENSLDVIVLIFVLSAIHPDNMGVVANNCFKYLKPGGLVLFRDYGRYDLAQLRFKTGKCLQQNFYVRGDGTRVYFFEQDEIKTLFQNAGFLEEQNIVDRRLQVNRGRMLKMYRVWIQAKFKKPSKT